MDEYMQGIIKSRCPYTDVPCLDKIPCVLCQEYEYSRKFPPGPNKRKRPEEGRARNDRKQSRGNSAKNHICLCG